MMGGAGGDSSAITYNIELGGDLGMGGGASGSSSSSHVSKTTTIQQSSSSSSGGSMGGAQSAMLDGRNGVRLPSLCPSVRPARVMALSTVE